MRIVNSYERGHLSSNEGVTSKWGLWGDGGGAGTKNGAVVLEGIGGATGLVESCMLVIFAGFICWSSDSFQ
jgi:hypothetical protein